MGNPNRVRVGFWGEVHFFDSMGRVFRPNKGFFLKKI